MKRIPRYVSCRRPGCDQIRKAWRVADHQRGKYCSRRCAALVNRNGLKRGVDHLAAMRAKGMATKRRKMAAKIAQCSTLREAFSMGYKLGLRSKCRHLHRLVREIRAAKGRAA